MKNHSTFDIKCWSCEGKVVACYESNGDETFFKTK